MGFVDMVGSDFSDLTGLKADLQAAGAPTVALDVADQNEFARSLLVDGDSSLVTVCRLIAGQGAGQDGTLREFGTTAYSMQGEQWSAPSPLGKFVITQEAEAVDVGWGETASEDSPTGSDLQGIDKNESKDATGNADGMDSGRTDCGTNILSGTVRVHDESFRGERTDSVVSIVLDEDMPYEYEYKGIVQSEAHDVLLTTTGSETFGANRYDEWAQYDGLHIVVECEGLQGTCHGVSYWAVDTLATGGIHPGRGLDGARRYG